MLQKVTDDTLDDTLLRRRIEKLTSLLDVAKAFIALRDVDTLLHTILSEAVKVVEADRGSIWIVDHERNELWTKVAQGLAAQTLRIPVGVGIAGQVAALGEVINITNAYEDPRFNPQVDRATGYKTYSILAVPMRLSTGQVTGVLQVLNKADQQTFNSEDDELLQALGAYAAPAVENAILYEEIDRLFEGFVHASVQAIESRDPTTSGHSARVATLTLGIAECVDKATSGPYADIHFTVQDMREVRYAALLHDFGKVGVREDVLVKAKKLYPWELEHVALRFQLLSAQKENAYLRARLAALRAGAELPDDYGQALARELQHLQHVFDFVKKCNEPTVLESGGFEQLLQLHELSYVDNHGQSVPVLAEWEIQRLSIPKGSLDERERRDIESHVTHTYRFLSKIPWTRDLRRVPGIAYGHHEKLDGSGYPLALTQEHISLQSRMMTVADIYDALTAQDRPYKKAVPHERALAILEEEAKQNQIEPGLFQIFVDGQVHVRVGQSV